MGKKKNVQIIPETPAELFSNIKEDLKVLPELQDASNAASVALAELISKKPRGKEKQRAVELNKNSYDAALQQVSRLRHVLKLVNSYNEHHFTENLKSSMLHKGLLMNLLSDRARTLPLYVDALSGFPGPLVGAIPLPESKELSVGMHVAAFVKDMWILAEILQNTSSFRYEVRDIDDEGGTPTTHVVGRKRVIPLPMFRADPAHHDYALFKKNAWVLALYPQTTCFYKGIVRIPPETATDNYQVSFEDDTYDAGFAPALHIPQRYVIAYKKMKGKKKRVSKSTEEE